MKPQSIKQTQRNPPSRVYEIEGTSRTLNTKNAVETWTSTDDDFWLIHKTRRGLFWMEFIIGGTPDYKLLNKKQAAEMITAAGYDLPNELEVK